MTIYVCIGSSCHLKNSYGIIELLETNLEARGLRDQVTIRGSFCMGSCNRSGVTVRVEDEIHTGITVEEFMPFFEKFIVGPLQSDR